MANELALKIYTDSASIVGATLQEALRVALKDGSVQAENNKWRSTLLNRTVKLDDGK